jgi:hypothetical protein
MAALESAGTVLGAIGMLAFALTFSLTVQYFPTAFIAASLAWAVVSIASWCVPRKMRTVRRLRASDVAGGGSANPWDF